MAILNVAQFKAVGKDWNGNTVQVAYGFISSENVDFTSGETDSVALDEDCRIVRVLSDADCRISFGTAPTATTSDILILSGTPEYFGITPGHKVSVIGNA